MLDYIPFSFVMLWLLIGSYFAPKWWYLILLIPTIIIVFMLPLHDVIVTLSHDVLPLLSQVFFAYVLSNCIKIKADIAPYTTKKNTNLPENNIKIKSLLIKQDLSTINNQTEIEESTTHDLEVDKILSKHHNSSIINESTMKEPYKKVLSSVIEESYNVTVANVTTNVFIFCIAGFFASIIGTMCASALFANLVAQLNCKRKEARHVMIIFTILVANVCGILLPTGDLPLLIGVANGMDFFWALRNIWLECFVTVVILLVVFIIIDSCYYLYFDLPNLLHNTKPRLNANKNTMLNICYYLYGWQKVRIYFANVNLICLLGCCISCIFLILGIVILASQSIFWQNYRTVTFLLSLFASFFTISFADSIGQAKVSHAMRFIVELGCIFVSILLTICPVHELVSNTVDIGQMSVSQIFWYSGLLSSMMDNVPTYLIFLKSIQQHCDINSVIICSKLKAMSIATIFFGAFTYTGNLPNMIVKEISESYDIKMPMSLNYCLIVIVIFAPIMKIISYMII